MVKQRAVDAGALEVRRLLQSGNMTRIAQPVTNPLLPEQMQHSMPTELGQFVPPPGHQLAEMAQTVSLYVGIEAPPHFNLLQRLRGPGKPAV